MKLINDFGGELNKNKQVSYRIESRLSIVIRMRYILPLSITPRKREDAHLTAGNTAVVSQATQAL